MNHCKFWPEICFQLITQTAMMNREMDAERWIRKNTKSLIDDDVHPKNCVKPTFNCKAFDFMYFLLQIKSTKNLYPVLRNQGNTYFG